jgi:methionyl-tRNA formyltransferase
LAALDMLEQWDGNAPLGTVQDQALASKAPRLKKSDGEVDWSQSAQRICDQVRALQPWPGTFTQWQRTKGPMRLLLQRVSVVDGDAAWSNAQPGSIVAIRADQVIVATGHGFLALHEVQPAGKRVLSTREFLRGYPATLGDRLGASPNSGG